MRRPPLRLLQPTCALCGTGRAVSSHTQLCSHCAARNAPAPLRQVLHEHRMTVRELAELLGVCQRTISRAASGEPIGAAAAARIGRALRIDPAVLIAGTAPPFRSPKEPRR